MFCLQTPIPDQACSNRASKQRKPRKQKVAASHRKSTVVCERTKKLKFPEICLWHKQYIKHWVGKQSEPRPLLQRRPANPGGYRSHRISQNLTESQWKKWIENVEPRPGVTWLNSSDHPTSQVPGPGTSQIFPVSTRWLRLTQHRSSLGMDHNNSAGRWLNESMHLYSSLKHCDILWSCDYHLGRVIEWRKHDEIVRAWNVETQEH